MTESAALKAGYLLLWGLILLPVGGRSALAQDAESQPPFDLVEIEMMEQGVREGIVAFQNLVCQPDFRGRMWEQPLVQSRVVRQQAFALMARDFPPYVEMSAALEAYLPGIAGTIAVLEQIRADSEMEHWDWPRQAFGEMPPDEAADLLTALGAGRPFRIGSLFLEYQSIMNTAREERTPEQVYRLRLLLPLVKQLLTGLEGEDQEAQE
ncbi:MAG: hypothetical protein OYL41_10980 [Acidobacteriota bacterium]|nr:hypothetical protein [Bryobacterales bacterium]MDE3262491.1 hypothetical protein [Acidobacteriota bacterium]